MAKEMKSEDAQVKRRKISVKSVKLSDQEEGFTFRGIYKGKVLGEPFRKVNEATGEIVEKQLTSVIMESDGGERVAYVADKGLIGALNDAMVKEGQKIEAVKLAKTKIGKGRTMNQYDIYALE